VGGQVVAHSSSAFGGNTATPILKMQRINFDEVVEKIVEHDSRFRREAYVFLREALEYTQRTIVKNKRDEVRHVSGKELLIGLRELALEQFGPMASTVLAEWGINSCEDLGEIVFNMVEFNLLAKTDTDTREDFKGAYDFFEAFRKPYLPSRLSSTDEEKPVKV
jgi:uncharacterized repeat protein (TIGR04138 family)